jgi:hypothetical protein
LAQRRRRRRRRRPCRAAVTALPRRAALPIPRDPRAWVSVYDTIEKRNKKVVKACRLHTHTHTHAQTSANDSHTRSLSTARTHKRLRRRGVQYRKKRGGGKAPHWPRATEGEYTAHAHTIKQCAVRGGGKCTKGSQG